MAARPTLAELAERPPEDDQDEPSVVQALIHGLEQMREAMEGHQSGDQTPLHVRLRRSAQADDPKKH